MKHEVICKVAVKVFRWNNKLFKSPYALMFRVHDAIEDASTSHSSAGHKTRVGNSTPIQFDSCCSDPHSFRAVINNALDVLGLFHFDNNKLLSDMLREYFHSCFIWDRTTDPTSPKVLVIEVFRKYVFTAKSRDEKLQKSNLDIVLDQEDYSETTLREILGTLHLLISHGCKLSSAPSIDELSQVKAAIGMLIYDGNRTKYEEDQCSVCLERFCQGQTIAKMPCSHIFHKKYAFDTEQLLRAMEQLKNGKAVDIPKYDFTSYENVLPARRVNPFDVIILEGILIFHDPRVRDFTRLAVRKITNLFEIDEFMLW